MIRHLFFISLLFLVALGIAFSGNSNHLQPRNQYHYRVTIDPPGSGNTDTAWTDFQPKLTDTQIILSNARVHFGGDNAGFAKDDEFIPTAIWNIGPADHVCTPYSIMELPQ